MYTGIEYVAWHEQCNVQGVITPYGQLRPGILTLYTKEGVVSLRFLPYIIGSKGKMYVWSMVIG